MLKMSKSLSSLIGEYPSDSDNEDSVINSESTKYVQEMSIPTTAWTECVDPATELPYYWNIDTKEVTWEKPDEYQKYLNYIFEKLPNIPDNCWIVGYSDNKIPYYVNEYTRVVSWKKPLNFKENTNQIVSDNTSSDTSKNHIFNNNKNLLSQEKKLTSDKNKLNRQISKKSNIKKKYPKSLENNSDDEKIELISSYSAPSDSSSDEESNENKSINNEPKTKKKIALVAAYETDESDSEEEKEESKEKKVEIFKCLSSKKSKINEKSSKVDSPVAEKDLNSSESSHIQIDTFASIITGGKVDTEIHEEINKLKMELEKEFSNFDASTQQLKIEEKPITQNNFDEKHFQRKKRIQFNTLTVVKPTINLEINSMDSSDNLEGENSTEQMKEKQKKSLYSNFKRGHVEFVNNSCTNGKEVKNDMEEKPNTNEQNSDDNKKLKLEIDDLSDLIIGKVKFLTVGRPEVSTVQIINIQLETLLTAYRSSSLNCDYFFKWLKTISDDLVKLEKSAAPDGWECNWDRQNSQYFYKNLETNEIRWEFPVIEDENNKNSDEEISTKNDANTEENTINNNGVVEGNKIDDSESNCIIADSAINSVEIKSENVSRGEDEMDISTTPPPNEHEQIKYMGAYPMSGNWDADNAPPPPIISKKAVITKPPTTKDINCELASFYSDIASLETVSPSSAQEKSISSPPPSSNIPFINTNNSTNNTTNSVSDDSRSSSPPILTTITPSSSNDTKLNLKKKLEDDNTLSGIPKKKKKKIKVQCMGQKMQEVSTLVAKWNKVKKELGS